jgi:hypothetical protein
LTTIQFDKEEEEDILNKGLQYNIAYNNPKQWIERLVIETEVAISKLPEQQQEGNRFLAKHNIEKILKSNKQYTNKSIENKIIKTIKQKLINNEAVITKADKGKTVVIINNQELIDKVNTYVTENGLQKLPKDPTMKFQEQVKATLKTCNNVINKQDRYRCIQIKPVAPKLNITIKIHKGEPIRPIVNYKQAPAYNIAKVASNWLRTNYELKNEYNVINSTQVANKIKI